MPKITYTAAKGLVQEAGSGVVIESDSVFFSTSPFFTVQTLSTTGAITAPGVYVITSSTGGAKTITLPSVSAFPGANFVFRIASANAHILTGSSVDQAPVFTGRELSATGAHSAKVGSKLAFTSVIGQSVVLVSDGLRYCVVGGSGSVNFSESLPA